MLGVSVTAEAIELLLDAECNPGPQAVWTRAVAKDLNNVQQAGNLGSTGHG